MHMQFSHISVYVLCMENLWQALRYEVGGPEAKVLVTVREAWPFAVACCDTRTSEDNFVFKSICCFLKMSLKITQSK